MILLGLLNRSVYHYTTARQASYRIVTLCPGDITNLQRLTTQLNCIQFLVGDVPGR